MSTKVLVAYATRFGSTAEVASAIAEELRDEDTEVDVAPMRDDLDLAPYQAVVLGASVRGCQWLPEATCFVGRHREELKQRRVAYFLTCGRLREESTEARLEASAYLDPVRQFVPEVEPVAAACFGGCTRGNWFVSLLVHLAGLPTGDWRNWSRIRTWGAAIRPSLLG